MHHHSSFIIHHSSFIRFSEIAEPAWFRNHYVFLEKQWFQQCPMRGALTHLAAADLSTVRTFLLVAANRWKISKQQISALYVLFHFWMRSHEKFGSSRSQHCMRFSTFRRKKAFISNQIPNKKSRIQGGSLARRGDKFKGGRSQHCTYFSIFCCEAMKNLAAVDLSTVHAFLLLGAKNLLSLIKLLVRNPGSRAGPLRGVATNLRAVHLSIVSAFIFFVAKRWKIWQQ